MKRNQIIAFLTANGVTGAESMSDAELRAKLVEVLRAQATAAVPAGTDPADVDQVEEEEFDKLLGAFLVTIGKTYTSGNAWDIFEKISIVEEEKKTSSTTGAYIEYNGSKHELASARFEKKRKASIKFLSFTQLGDVQTAKNEKAGQYFRVLVEAIVYDAKGKGVQTNFTMNSSLLAKLKNNSLFAGIKFVNDIPQMQVKDQEGNIIKQHVVYALVELSSTIAGKTTWGSGNTEHIAIAEKAGTLVYTEKGKKFAAVYDKTTSEITEEGTRESLDRIVGTLAPETAKQIEFANLTPIEKALAEKAGMLQLENANIGDRAKAIVEATAQLKELIEFYESIGMDKVAAVAAANDALRVK